MNASNFNDTLVSIPTDSGGKDAFDNRPQTGFRNWRSSPFQSDFNFKKPRFSEKNSSPRIPLSVNRPKLSIPYKSQPCLPFQRGKCYHGENCHFSHTVSEIRPGFNTVCEMRVCSIFARGKDCPYGDRCRYLHQRDDRESCRIIVVNRQSDGIGTVVNRGGDTSGSSNAGVNHDKLNTKPCAIFERYGSCSIGKECTFAHVKTELQGHGNLAEPGKGHAYGSKLVSELDPMVLSEKELLILEKMQQKGKGKIQKINKIYGDWINDTPSKD